MMAFSFQNGSQICCFKSLKLSSFVLFSQIITSAILLKQLVTSGAREYRDSHLDFISVTVRQYSRRLQ